MTASGAGQPLRRDQPKLPGLLVCVGITMRSAYWCLCRRRHKHQLRHAHAVELAREGVPLPVIQRQLGHSYVSTTSVYMQGIDVEEIIGTIHARRAPMMHVSAGLEL